MTLRKPVTFTLRLLGLLAVAMLVACGGGSGSGNGSSAESSGFPNDQAAYDYFVGQGLTNVQAAGIVGNLDQESGVNPAAVQSGGPGRGIAQWSTGGRWDTASNDNATWYASSQNESVDSLQLQLAFIWYELTTFSHYGLAALQASTTVSAATSAFASAFEGCGNCKLSQRVTYAQNVLNAFGSSTVEASDGGTPCTANGVAGQCMDVSDCAATPGSTSVPGYCAGPASIECCIAVASGDDGGASESDGGTCSALGVSGQCMSVTDCTSSANQTSVAGDCPGADSIQCCIACDASEQPCNDGDVCCDGNASCQVDAQGDSVCCISDGTPSTAGDGSDCCSGNFDSDTGNCGSD